MSGYSNVAVSYKCPMGRQNPVDCPYNKQEGCLRSYAAETGRGIVPQCKFSRTTESSELHLVGQPEESPTPIQSIKFKAKKRK